jgi:uncharacterized protein (DUF488 family)
MLLYTIGFTQKRAEEFFGLLRHNKINRLVDIRLNPGGQLSGFAKQEDLPYFLSELAAGCQYIHIPELAPTKELLKDYRAGLDWGQYVERFEKLMDERGIPENLNKYDFETSHSCLLCSEPAPEHCHRGLIAQQLKSRWGDVEIIHL